MSIDMKIAEVFSHFIGEVLTLVESTPVSREKQESLKRLMERKIYDVRNGMMDGENDSLINNMQYRLKTYASVTLQPKELSEAFDRALDIIVNDLKGALKNENI